jgi:hypothetical protein
MIMGKAQFVELESGWFWWCHICGIKLERVPPSGWPTWLESGPEPKPVCCEHYMYSRDDVLRMRRQKVLTILCETGIMLERRIL